MGNMNLAFLQRLTLPTQEEHACPTQRVAASDRFLQEVLAEVQCLECLAYEYSVHTLIHVTYMCAAIMKGTFIDYRPGDSAILKLLAKLPSNEVWKTYVAVEGHR